MMLFKLLERFLIQFIVLELFVFLYSTQGINININFDQKKNVWPDILVFNEKSEIGWYYLDICYRMDDNVVKSLNSNFCLIGPYNYLYEARKASEAGVLGLRSWVIYVDK